MLNLVRKLLASLYDNITNITKINYLLFELRLNLSKLLTTIYFIK